MGLSEVLICASLGLASLVGGLGWGVKHYRLLGRWNDPAEPSKAKINSFVQFWLRRSPWRCSARA